MHNLDEKHLTQPGFEPNTSEFWSTTGPIEPSGSAFICCTMCSVIVNFYNLLKFYILHIVLKPMFVLLIQM